jgi:hypothetical protein
MKLRDAAEYTPDYEKYQSLTEWADDDGDDDELSPAEKALVAKADTDLAKRGVKVKNFNPDKMVGQKPSKEDDSEEKETSAKRKPTEKSAEKSTDAADKPTGSHARGDKSSAARKFLQDHPDASRKQFVQFVSNHGVSPAYANTMFYALKKRLKEVFYITNDKDQVLAEGDVWTVFEDYSKRLMMFKSEWNAKSKTFKTGGKVNRTKV